MDNYTATEVAYKNGYEDGLKAVNRPKGKWIDNGIENSVLSECSICGFKLGSSSYNYCPHCGTKMN